MKWWFDLLDWYRSYRLARLQLQLEMAQAPFKAMQEMVQTMAAQGAANTQVLQTWLESFTSPVTTHSTTLRDEDEIRMELERLGLERPELHQSMDAAIKSGQFAEFRKIINEID